MKNFSIKTLVAIGIGAAIFAVLARYVSIPTPIPSTTLTIQYAVLALFALLYGPAAGVLIGLIGHTISDMMGGSPWWSWIIASAVAGLLMGLLMQKIDIQNGEFGKKEIVTFNVAQVIAHAVSWLLIAPLLDVLIYAEPAVKVFVQGIGAFVGNAVMTGIVGTLLAVAYAKSRTKKGSLDKE